MSNQVSLTIDWPKQVLGNYYLLLLSSPFAQVKQYLTTTVSWEKQDKDMNSYFI